MSLFGTSMEVNEEILKLTEKVKSFEVKYNQTKALLDDERRVVDGYKIKVRDLEWKISIIEKENELRSQEKLNTLRTSMEKSLIESDIKRVEAVSRLEIYEKMDTRADANTIKEMIGKLIEAMGRQGVNVIK